MSLVACQCGRRFEAAAHLAGKRVACPGCGQGLQIPAASPTNFIVACRCGQRFQATPAILGKTVQCSACGGPLTIGALSSPALPVSSPNNYGGFQSVTPNLPRPATAAGLYSPSHTKPRAMGLRISPPMIAVAATVLALVLIGIAGVVLFPWMRGLGGKLKDSVARIQESSESSADVPPPDLAHLRELGEPTTPAELEQFYRLPPGTTDTTDSWLAATGVFGSDAFSESDGPSLSRRDMAGTVPLPGQPWQDFIVARELLDRYREPMEQLHLAASKGSDARYPTDFSDGIKMLLPYSDALRASFRMLQLEAYVRAHQGNPAAVARSLHTMFAMSRTIDRHPLIVMQLVAYGLDRQACMTLADLLPSAKLTDDDLTLLKGDLAKSDVNDSIYRAFVGERVMALWVFNHRSEFLDVFAAEELGREAGFTPQIAEAIRNRYPDSSVSRDREFMLGMMSRYLEASRQPWPQKLDTVNAIEADFDAAAAGELTQRPLITLLCTPAVKVFFSAAGQVDASRRLATAAIAVEQYRRRFGQPPNQLQDMVPAFIDAVPRDPFDGQPLRYSVRNGVWQAYSIGFDRADNGGLGDADLVFPPPRKSSGSAPTVSSLATVSKGATIITTATPIPTTERALDLPEKMIIYESVTANAMQDLAQDFLNGSPFARDDRTRKIFERTQAEFEVQMKKIEELSKDSVCRKYRITRKQLDEIVAEGDAKGWKKGTTILDFPLDPS